MPAGVRPLARGEQHAVLAFLNRAPYDNVFLAWLAGGSGVFAARSSIFVYRDDRGAIAGTAFFGRQIVLAAQDEGAIAAFAAMAPAHRFERMIVAPRPAVERYWEHVRGWHVPPRVVRERQPVFAVDSQLLRHGGDERVRVRPAHPDEWSAVAENSAQMIEHELEYDPRGAEFTANVRMMIDRGLWWVGECEGELCFFVNLGPRSRKTLQLQGIWTPPALRGNGYATAALAKIAEQLLGEVPTLCLYVNDFNTPAIALYERTGFARTGEFTTLLF